MIWKTFWIHFKLFCSFWKYNLFFFGHKILSLIDNSNSVCIVVFKLIAMNLESRVERMITKKHLYVKQNSCLDKIFKILAQQFFLRRRFRFLSYMIYLKNLLRNLEKIFNFLLCNAPKSHIKTNDQIYSLKIFHI